MRGKISCAAVILVLISALVGTARAELVPVPRSDFLEPAVAGFGSKLLPKLLNIPLDTEIGSTSCGLGGTLSLEINGSVSLENPGYGIFWIGTGTPPLKVEVGVSNLEFVADLHVVASNCLGFISFNIDSPDTLISVEQVAVGFNSIPYLNTDTNKIVLDTQDDQSQVVFAGLELFGDFLGLEEILEAIIQPLVADYLYDLLLDEGILADTGDGGAVHDVTEDFMNTIYIPNMCGCITVTSGKPTTGNLILNTALYLLPVGLILGLRRRMRHS